MNHLWSSVINHLRVVEAAERKPHEPSKMTNYLNDLGQSRYFTVIVSASKTIFALHFLDFLGGMCPLYAYAIRRTNCFVRVFLHVVEYSKLSHFDAGSGDQ